MKKVKSKEIERLEIVKKSFNLIYEQFEEGSNIPKLEN